MVAAAWKQFIYTYIARGLYRFQKAKRPPHLSTTGAANEGCETRCFLACLVHYYSRNMAAQNIALSIAHKTIVYGSKQTFLTALTGLHGRQKNPCTEGRTAFFLYQSIDHYACIVCCSASLYKMHTLSGRGGAGVTLTTLKV